MPQMTNVQGIKIRDRIEAIFGKADADEFSAALPLSKSADYIRKFKWAKDVCNYLESKYTPEQIKTLRLSCSCHPGDNEKENTKRIYNESKSLDEFCGNYNKVYAGVHPVWHEGDDLFFSYPTCYCSCVKRVNEPIFPDMVPVHARLRQGFIRLRARLRHRSRSYRKRQNGRQPLCNKN